MRQRLHRLIKRSAHSARRFVLFLTIAGMLGTAAPAHAAVPTYVVEFELNTKFERSLERFLFDLFNTLQRREEDFTAAFELQKIEKAREDTSKLFQEVQEELNGFGLAFTIEREALYPGSGVVVEGESVRDPRLVGSGDRDCEVDSDSGSPTGCPPTISPIKDSRIIHDPYQYLFGEAYTKAQTYAYCFFNYLIWDQRGWLPNHYGWLDPTGNNPLWQPKSTYDPGGRLPSGGGTDASVAALLERRNAVVVGLARGNYYALNNPFHKIYGPADSQPGFESIEPLCRQVMYVVGAETPVTAEQKVNVWLTLREQDGLREANINEINAFRRSILQLPTLVRSTARRPIDELATWSERALSLESSNTVTGVLTTAQEELNRIIDETEREREATYIAGQGIRPEQFYQTHLSDAGLSGTPNARFDINTEYVISPAVLLLQKMQAATQASFDLAGQGFLYLDAESTDPDILAAYNLVSTRGNNEERRICNNAGACQLLDAWLKPTASFRSAATIGEGTTADGNPDAPLVIGPSSPDALAGQSPGAGLLGSGLPAPWEDEGSYVNLTNEKSTLNTDRRYTIARFLVDNVRGIPGNDEFDTVPAEDLTPAQDQLGLPWKGVDYPLNDWFDRVFEIYESGDGIDLETGDSTRPDRSHQFQLSDWQCYVATWFFPQRSASEQFGDTVTFFYGTEEFHGTSVAQEVFWEQYCN